MAKILIIVPTEETKAIATKTIEEYRDYYRQNFNEKEDSEIEVIVQLYGEKVDLNLYNPDIVVARGFTAIALRKIHQSIPIVELPITTIDVLSAVNILKRGNVNNEPIALLGMGGDISFQAEAASQLSGISVVPFHYFYTHSNDEQIAELLDEISSKGFRHIIGGVRLVSVAKQRDLISTFIECGRESVWLALREAEHIAGIRRKERERAARFEAILNHSHEGIISTDVNNNIIHINSSAGKILNVDISSSIGSNLDKIIPDPNFAAILNDEREHSDELFKTKDGRIILNKVDASLGSEMVGKVVTFQNINNVKDTEAIIRSKLHHRGLTAKYSFNDIVGESFILEETIKKAQTFAKVPSNVLIIGDTGTGKELFAQSMHNYSSRKNKPFVAVNCAAIPENLMESEFFGYAGGAFTGASKEGKAGLFELAHEGTIFLDEISEIPLNLQSKLLRVIQESEVMRIGYDKIIPIDIRIICASNKDLKSLVDEGSFRKDLYYRLCVLQLRLPPLREREKDILLLANHYISRFASTLSKNMIQLSTDAQKLFLRHSWDGNIRELRNVCEQLVALNETGTISVQEVSNIIPIFENDENEDYSTLTLNLSNDISGERKQFEKNLIIKALKECNYNKTKAAALLGMNRSTLWKKLKEYNVEFKTTL